MSAGRVRKSTSGPASRKGGRAAAEGAGGKPTPAAAGGVVRVTGPARGRWRIGRHFGPEAVEIALADLSEEERARLEADPALTIEIVGGA